MGTADFSTDLVPRTVITLCIGTDRPEQTVDPDQMPQNTASDQDLHCLPYIQQYFRYISG